MADAIRLLANYCSVDTARILALTCQYFHQSLYAEWRSKQLKPFTLTTHQYLFCLKIHEIFQYKRKCIVSAAMGWGKTVMAIYYIMYIWKDCNVLISVPPPVLKVWIEELTRTGLISPKPADSIVLVAHSTRPMHQKYHAKDDPDWFTDHRIILTTNKIMHKIHGHVDLVVLDEYHKLKSFDNPEVKILGLTAENLESTPSSRVLAIRDITFSDRIPDVSYHYYMVDNDRDAS